MRHLYRLHEARYRFAAGSVVSRRVLDVACGSGYGSALLADAGAKYVCGINVSPAAIEYARSRYRRPNVEYVVGDASALALSDASMDVVVSFETIEHLPVARIKPLLSELKRVLKPGGIAFISTPNGDASYRLGAYHTVEFSPVEFQSLLAGRFTWVSIFGQRTVPRWYLNLAAKAGRMPFVWNLDALVRAAFFASSKIEDVPTGGPVPMFFVARCQP